MRKSQYMLLVSITTLLLTSCSSHLPSTSCSTTQGNKNIAFYSDPNSPHAPYRILGTASVSRHNILGMERTNDTMQVMMKQLAANMGGDGLINLNPVESGDMKAQIIAYEKVLI